eukprot:TRINITY_DN719_c0_g2_i1.p1 TRINITY_DN719_c0_g2~~TRINITY_DN719_c0_g2_i1.p1  ORF type:complete len:2625 (-),score=670.03 TRINITY_DN719_c0_g2_i1:1508-9382(-)
MGDSESSKETPQIDENVSQEEIEALDSIISRIEANVTLTSFHTRKEIFTEIVPSFLMRAGTQIDEFLPSLIRVYFHTLRSYNDRKSRLLVEASIHRSCTRVKQIGSRLLSRIDKNIATFDEFHGGRELCTLFRWTCVVTSAIAENLLKPENLATLISIQGRLLLALAACEHNAQQNAHAAFRDMLTKVPTAFNAYMEVLQSQELTTESCVVGSLLVTHARSNAKAKLSPIFKESMMAAFISLVMSAINKPRPGVVEGFLEYLHLVDESLFAQAILPALDRSLKRTPEIVFSYLDKIVSSFSFDLSPYAREHLTATSRGLLRGSSDEIRALSQKYISSIFSKCSHTDTVVALVADLFGTLTGSDGPLPYWYDRANVLRTINEAGRTPNRDAIPAVASLICEKLLPYIKAEASEEARVIAFQILGDWSMHLTDVPKAFLQFLISTLGTEKKDGVRRACLDCVYRMGRNELLLSTLAEVGPTLLTMLKNTAGKIATRSEFVLVVRIILAFAPKSKAFADHLASKAVSPLIFTNDSSVFNLTQLRKASEPELVSTCDVLISLLTDQAPIVAPQLSKLKNLLDAMVYLFLSPFAGSRKSARRLQEANLLGPITAALIRTLSEWIEKVCAGAIEDKVSDDMIARALLSLSFAQHSKETVVSLLLLSHHPIVVRNRWAFPRLWTSVTRKLFASTEEHDRILSESGDALMQTLFSPNGIYSQDSFRRQTAFNTLRTVANIPVFKPSAILENLCKNVASYVDPSDNEFNIYKTPAGVVYDEAVRNTYVPEVVENKNVKLSKAEKMYGKTDDDWEQNLKAELEAKKASQTQKLGFKSTGDPKHDEVIRKKLEEEASIRERVALKHFECLQTLNAISTMVYENRQLTMSNLFRLRSTLQSVMKSRLMSDDANETLKTVCNCMGSKFSPLLRHAIYASLHVLMINNQRLKKEFKAASPRILARLAIDLANPGALSMTAQQFSFLFPIYKRILDNTSYRTQTHDASLTAIDMFLNDPEAVPATEIIPLLIFVASTYPGVQAHAVSSLKTFCAVLPQAYFPSLWEGFVSPLADIRRSTSETFLINELVKNGKCSHDAELASRFFMISHDVDEESCEVGKQLWATAGMTLDGRANIDILTKLLLNIDEPVRLMVSSALASLVSASADLVIHLIEQLRNCFSTWSLKAPQDSVRKLNAQGRQGVANALTACASHFTQSSLKPLFDFIISKGLADEHEEVRKCVITASIEIIHQQGANHLQTLLPIFEQAIDKKSGFNDRVREGAIVLLGALSKFLTPADPKVDVIMKMLVTALNSRSEVVMKSISIALGPLIGLVPAKAEEVVNGFLNTMSLGKTPSEKRGAAYGLAGVIKGLGIPSLKQFDIIQKLQDALGEASKGAARQGALYGFECLCTTLGRLFEPYIVKILPFLLTAFGDSNGEVRTAALGTSRVIMSQLSGHGVKFVLPVILKGLDEKAWRARQGSIEMLGNMAYCAPKQLSTCLPAVVPKIVEVMVDTHPQVQEAAKEALNRIASVIQNAEVQGLVSTLIGALTEPNIKTKAALEALLNTSFVHRVDSPSLALIVPVLHRGLRERNSETKKRAAQIIGSMCSLSDAKDLIPYLPMMLPTLRECLVDPIPEARAVSARAIGSLVKGVGEEPFGELIPWMMEAMQSELSSVERSGAAQGLSEVVSAMGIERLESILEQILVNSSETRAATREGMLYFISYLPNTVGSKLEPYLVRLLPPILRGLADEAEAVRDISIRAGKSMINKFGSSSVDLLLPAILEGLHHDNWRIRQSSIQLLGDLLYRIAGASGKIILDGDSDEEGPGTEAQAHAILQALGRQKRNEVMAMIYMMRADNSTFVRQESLHVWKSVVSNTPKTLRESLPNLMQQIIVLLSGTNSELQQLASRTLGDVVKKLGDRVLPEIIPILEKGLESSAANTRQGVCLGLKEVMASAPKWLMSEYVDALIPAVGKALCDNLPEVREAAAQAFDTLHRLVGNKAMDEILPEMMRLLEDPQLSERALDGIRQILGMRSASVLSYLIPKLVHLPMKAANAKALSAIAQASPGSLNRFLSSIVPALISGSASENPQVAEASIKSIKDVVLAVFEDGLQYLFDTIFNALKSDDASTRCGGCIALDGFCAGTNTDYTFYLRAVLQWLVKLMNDPSEKVVVAAYGAMDSLSKKVKKDELVKYMKFIQEVFHNVVEVNRKLDKDFLLPGLCIPKGPGPLLQIFLHGLMNGSTEQREQAALCIYDIIDLSNTEVLKPFTIQITGPLIRIIGDRFPWQVKAAILLALRILLVKGSATLKPFIPQLQTTFVKALSDPTRVVRNRAAVALSRLITLGTRVDPLVTELTNSAKSSQAAIREAILKALEGAIAQAGSSVTGPTKTLVRTTMIEYMAAEDDITRVLSARVFGALVHAGDQQEFDSLVKYLTTMEGEESWLSSCGKALALGFALSTRSDRFEAHFEAISSKFVALIGSDKVSTKHAAAEAVGKWVCAYGDATNAALDAQLNVLLPKLATILTDDASDVRRAAVVAVKQIAKFHPQVSDNHLAPVVSNLMTCARGSNLPVKLASERALLYSLRAHVDDETVQKYMRLVDEKTAKLVSDYARRVLKQLSTGANSDAEDEEVVGAEVDD